MTPIRMWSERSVIGLVHTGIIQLYFARHILKQIDLRDPFWAKMLVLGESSLLDTEDCLNGQKPEAD